MNSGSWAVTCCACAEAVNANAAIEKINFFISVSLSLAPGYYHLPLVNVRLAKRGGAKPQIICTHRPSHCHSARILIWSTPNVSIYEIFHGQVPLVVKEVQFTLWGIPAENRADEFAKFMSADFYSYALTLLYVSMLLHHVCKGSHFYAIYQTFLEIFLAIF